MQGDFNLEETVKVYLKIRDAIEDLKERQDTEMKALKAQFQVVSDVILEFCNSQNLDSVKTSAGTISRRVSSRYWTNDWDSMYDFIEEHGAFGLLEKRLHQTNMKDFLSENPELLPKGLNVENEYTVVVRRSKGN